MKSISLKLFFFLSFLIVIPELWGQIILSSKNEYFEGFVNDILKQNPKTVIEFEFSSSYKGKTDTTEFVKVEWKKDNIFVTHSSIEYGATLEQTNSIQYKYLDGFFSDIEKNNGNYIEHIKIDDKNYIQKGYRDGKIAIENKMLLDKNKNIIFTDHTNYYASLLEPKRIISSYTKKIIDKNTVLNVQETYDITNGKKKVILKSEIVETSTFNKEYNIKTITSKCKSILYDKPQPDSGWQTFFTFDNAGRIIKIHNLRNDCVVITYK